MNLEQFRKGTHSDRLLWDDYQALLKVKAGRIYRAESGVDMCRAANPKTGSTTRISLTRLRDRHGFVDPVKPREDYALNDAGRAALEAEVARRSAASTPGRN